MIGVILLVGLTSITCVSGSEYVRMNLEGTLPIILSAPHGGSKVHPDISNRQNGCYDVSKDTCIYHYNCTLPRLSDKCKIVTVRDMMTGELADLIYEKLTKYYGSSPKLVVNQITRKQIDMNRDKDEATMGVPLSEPIYDEYHSALRTARKSLPGRGILFDVHGHARPQKWTMLGYAIKGNYLDDMTDKQMENLAVNSSIRALAAHSSLSFSALLRGENVSFGAMMNAQGLYAVPSPETRSPGGATFYSGGYITRTYGSRDGGKIDAIQLETHTTVRTPKTNREQFAELLSNVIIKYFDTHYNDVVYDNGCGSNTPSKYILYYLAVIAAVVIGRFF